MSWKNILEQCLYPVQVHMVHPGSSRPLVKGPVISHLSMFFFFFSNKIFSVDLWLQYIQEEMGPLGQPENCGKIHWRAMKFLEGESVETFTTKYTLLQTGHLWGVQAMFSHCPHCISWGSATYFQCRCSSWSCSRLELFPSMNCLWQEITSPILKLLPIRTITLDLLLTGSSSIE